MTTLSLMLACTIPGAAAIALATRPRTGAGGAAVFGLAWWSVILLICETVGRVSFTRVPIGAACVGAGLIGALALVAQRRVLRTLRIGRAARGARLALAPWPVRALLVAWIALMVYAALAVWVVPATVPDVTRYHLPQAVAQVREGYIGMIPELDYRANHFPHGVQTLYAFAFLFTRDDRAMALTQIPISGLLWVAVAAMAARSCGIPRRWTLFTALLASFVGPVMLQMRAEMPDVGHAAGVIGAMVIATDPRRHFGRPWIALALALGIALGTKSSGPLVVVVALGAWFVGARRAHGSVQWVRLAAAVAIALLIGGWVYADNLIRHANPVFPMALKIGPITLPGPDAASGISMNPWMYDFGASPARRLIGGLARWPRLLLNTEPFDNMGSPAASGFGPVTALCVLGAALGSAAALVRGRLGAMFGPTRGRRTLAIFLVALLVYNAMFLSTVSLITAPQSTVDARYQLHLALLAPILAAWTGSVAKRRARLVWAWILALVAAHAAWSTLTGDAHRGLDVVRGQIVHERPRTWVYRGDPFYLLSDPEALYEILGDEDVIAFGRGWVYPLMFPDFERRVYPAGGLGPHMAVVDRLGVPREMVERLTARIAKRRQLERAGGAWGPRWNAFNRAWLESGGHELLRDYYKALARATGSRYLLSQAGRHPFFEDDPEWVLVLEERAEHGGWSTALYRFAGGASP